MLAAHVGAGRPRRKDVAFFAWPARDKNSHVLPVDRKHCGWADVGSVLRVFLPLRPIRSFSLPDRMVRLFLVCVTTTTLGVCIDRERSGPL